jgi:uncharacterized repeat protein (TIGR03806 family)
MSARWAAMAALLAQASCAKNECTPGGDGTYTTALYDKLSSYCMVGIEAGDVVPETGVTPYDQTTPLFSDYATKRRTIWMPPGTSAAYVADGPFDFPVGTIATKSFGWNGKWLETRVLVKSASGWTGASYVWNDDQSEATIQPGGGFYATPESDAYLVPNKNECIKCHESTGSIVPIGLRADRINRDYTYATGTENQLAHWSRVGILTGAPAPESSPALANFSDASLATDARARAYLAANCSYCHSSTGEARNTGLLLGADVVDPYRLGACKTPVATGKAAADLSYDVVPGNPDASIMIYRMQSTTPSIMMPEIGRSVVHTEGVSVVRDWITQLAGSCN